MEEIWSEIDYFPGYCVSNHGRVRNESNGYIMAQLINQSGVTYVGLNKLGIQHRRAVALLVARAYVPHEPLQGSAFDTPTHLDGDLNNNRADNLIWRPKWFAMRYHRQFHIPRQRLPYAIQEIETNEIFETPLAAAKRFGLLEHDLLTSIYNEEFVWPTYQRFRLMDKATIK